jgi:hypothetical protein
MAIVGYPRFASRLSAAKFLVLENRLPEIWFDNLTPEERAEVVRDLRLQLSKVRRHSLTAHALGVALAVVFLVLGLLVMSIGPADVQGVFSRWIWARPTPSGVAIHWGFLIAFAALGGFTADYILRGQRKVTRMWKEESTEIRETIARGLSRA